MPSNSISAAGRFAARLLYHRRFTCDSEPNVSSLLTFFLQLCLLKRGPQDLPASVHLLGVSAAVSLIVGALGTTTYFGGGFRALAASTLDTILIGGLVYATLAFAGQKPRFVQTATAVYGVSVLFGLVMLVVRLLADGLDLAPLAAMVNLIALGWIHVALGHVMRHALEMDLWAGIVIAVGYTIIGLTLVNTYIPPVAVPGS